MTTVRDAVLAVLRHEGLTRIFANPGSTEVAFLHDLPADFDFILGLHEASVVGMAAGHAIMSGSPALALLHTTAGLGNAVGALATARANRAPLVVIVGQQDRRHMISEPFLTGRLEGLAGDYPVSVHQPTRGADVPSLVARAAHDARLHRGPSLVIVPMDDWAQDADESVVQAAPRTLITSQGVDPAALGAVTEALNAAVNPVIVTGSSLDDEANWAALADLVDVLDCPVWQESHGARAAFDQASPRFAGHLPPSRTALRSALSDHDLVLLIGGHAFKQYLFDAGPFVVDGTQVIVLSDDPCEAVLSAADLVVLGPTAPAIAHLASTATRRPRRHQGSGDSAIRSEASAHRPSPRAVFEALADRLPARSTVIEECPSSRRILIDVIRAREPLGFVTPAMGGLGFALPAAVGMRLADPLRPIVAVVGDGSSLYSIQALWTAQRYGAGVLFVVMSNGGYVVMDRLAHAAGGDPAWPGFPEVSVTALAAGFGCPARRIEAENELLDALDELIPTLDTRTAPLLLDVAVTAD
jgi:benzoylformate decarboxylase